MDNLPSHIETMLNKVLYDNDMYDMLPILKILFKLAYDRKKVIGTVENLKQYHEGQLSGVLCAIEVIVNKKTCYDELREYFPTFED